MSTVRRDKKIPMGVCAECHHDLEVRKDGKVVCTNHACPNRKRPVILGPNRSVFIRL
jgi:hypothetical protein